MKYCRLTYNMSVYLNFLEVSGWPLTRYSESQYHRVIDARGHIYKMYNKNNFSRNK